MDDQPLTLSAIKESGGRDLQATLGFATQGQFEYTQRVAKMYAASNLIPEYWRKKESECAIAMNMAESIGADPMFVYQNLHVIKGKPSWSSPALIGMFNQRGQFSTLDYEFEGEEGTDSWGCRAVATELSTGKVKKGTKVTIAIAKAEGWHDKPGSKWKNIPEQMLRYRSAAWFIRSTVPDIGLGLQTKEELEDRQPIKDVVAEVVEEAAEVVVDIESSDTD